jgi:hypothetical protein
MDEFDKALWYIFVLSLALILVAYYAGSKAVGSTLFTGLNNTILTATGRNSQGNFAAYPGNAPTG